MPPVPNIPPALTGSKEGTFAFLTVRDRWPKILGKIVDQVHRYRHAHIAVHGEYFVLVAVIVVIPRYRQ
ncbi:unnamed protein product [Brugia timori]|uniref:Transposase n=1 Tax=Brugia timori TaxID=42155 RepID=A0A0R3QD02_9BILA|nr:unnamed protein product [Brugia timori]